MNLLLHTRIIVSIPSVAFIFFLNCIIILGMCQLVRYIGTLSTEKVFLF